MRRRAPLLIVLIDAPRFFPSPTHPPSHPLSRAPSQAGEAPFYGADNDPHGMPLGFSADGYYMCAHRAAARFFAPRLCPAYIDIAGWRHKPGTPAVTQKKRAFVAPFRRRYARYANVGDLSTDGALDTCGGHSHAGAYGGNDPNECVVASRPARSSCHVLARRQQPRKK